MYQQTHLAVRVPDRRGLVKSPVEALPGHIAPNEPNLRRGRFSGGPQPDTRSLDPAPLGFRAKQSQFGPKAKQRTSAVQIRSCDTLAAGVASAKQSQFPAAGAGSGPAKGPCRRWDRLYEQSQSARSDRDRRRSARSPAEVSLGLFAPNKPNWPTGRRPAAAGEVAHERVAGVFCAKQTQFRLIRFSRTFMTRARPLAGLKEAVQGSGVTCRLLPRLGRFGRPRSARAKRRFMAGKRKKTGHRWTGASWMEGPIVPRSRRRRPLVGGSSLRPLTNDDPPGRDRGANSAETNGHDRGGAFALEPPLLFSSSLFGLTHRRTAALRAKYGRTG
jgi:hypothetical protein